MRLPLEENENRTNLTPLIDVVFLLLIFFLVATRFDQEEKEVSIRVPDVYKARPVSAGPQEVIINITADGDYVVTGEKLSEPQVRGLITSLTKNNPADLSAVQIRTDMDAQVKYSMAVVGMCEDQKIKHSFAVLEKRQR